MGGNLAPRAERSHIEPVEGPNFGWAIVGSVGAYRPISDTRVFEFVAAIQPLSIEQGASGILTPIALDPAAHAHTSATTPDEDQASPAGAGLSRPGARCVAAWHTPQLVLLALRSTGNACARPAGH